MVQNLKPEDMHKTVKVVKEYNSADDALNSITARMAEKQLAMQAAQGKSVEDIMSSLNSKEKQEEQKQIYKKFFNEDEDGNKIDLKKA